MTIYCKNLKQIRAGQRIHTYAAMPFMSIKIILKSRQLRRPTFFQYEAMDLLKAQEVCSEKLLKYDADKYERMAKYCTSSINTIKRRNACVAGFSQSFATSQVRSCIMQHEWINLQRLILLLLDCSSDKEPLLWRIALTAFINSPKSSAVNLQQFFEECIGSTDKIELDEPGRFLQGLLTLPSEIDK